MSSPLVFAGLGAEPSPHPAPLLLQGPGDRHFPVWPLVLVTGEMGGEAGE